MATNTIHLQNLRSWDILSGASANADVAKHYDGVASPKLPTSEQLEYGAIALNIAKGFETLAIKNNNDEIVYIPFNVVTKVFEQGQKLNNLSGVTDDIIEVRSAVAENTEKIAGHDAIIISLGENVSAITESIDEINQRLNESVDKTDFEALEESLGFNDTEYEPQSEELQGKTVTEAIDYAIEAIKDIDFKDVSEQVKAIRESVSANTESINTLSDIVDEMELVHAAVFVHLNSQLGFDDDGTYHPAHEDFEGLNVTEAIDALYDNIVNSKKSSERYIGKVSASTTQAIAKAEQSIKSDVEKKLADANTYTNNKVGEAVESLENEFNTKVNKISGDTGAKISEIKATVEERIGTLSSNTESKLSKIKSDLGSKINETNEKLDTTSTSLSGKVGELNSRLELVELETLYAKDDIKEVSGETLDNSDKINKISSSLGFKNTSEYLPSDKDLSGKTVSEAIDAVYKKVKNVEEEIPSEEIIRLSEKVKNIASDVSNLSSSTETSATTISSRVEQINGQIAKDLANAKTELSAYTDTKVDNLSNDITDYISIVSTNIANEAKERKESDEYIKNTIKTTSGVLETEISTTSGILKTELSTTKSELESFENTTNKKFDSVRNEIAKAKSELEEGDEAISSSASAYTDSKFDELKKYADNTIVTNAEKYTDTKVKELDESLTDYVDDMGDVLSLYMSRVAWVEKNIDDETKARTEGDEKLHGEIEKVTDSSLLTIAETSAATTSLITKTRDYADELFAETNEAILALEKSDVDINKKADSALTRVNQVETVLSGRIDSVSSETNTIKAEFSSVSEKADKAYERSENIESLFVNDELAAAGAFNQFNGQLGFSENGEYLPSYEDLEGRSVTEAIDCIYAKCNGIVKSIKSISEKIQEMDSDSIISITHNNLVKLIDVGKLSVGRWYKILDYKPTLSKEYINKGFSVRESKDIFGREERNAGFYILVFAVSSEKIDENALCAPLDADDDNDAYFDSAEILSWRIKYDTCNDTSRYAWASTGGTGVIYYMEDEFGNSAHYDFKNIKKDDKFTFSKQSGSDFIDMTLVGEAYGNHIGEYIMIGNNTYKGHINGITVVSESGNVHGNEFMTNSHDLTISTKQLVNNRFDATNNITIKCDQFINNYVSGSYNINITESSTCGLYGFTIIK